MFVVVESGFQSPYVPGRFRPRKVDPVHNAVPVDRVEQGESATNSAGDHFSPGKSHLIQAYENIDTAGTSGRSPILAKDVMSSPVVSLLATATVQQAQDLFQNRRFRHIPVINDHGQVWGIVSDRDMLRGKADPSAYRVPSAFDPARTLIHPFMSQPVLVAHPEAEVRGIARIMFEEHVGAMPIVSEVGKLVGMVTRSDILRVLISHPDFDQWV